MAAVNGIETKSLLDGATCVNPSTYFVDVYGTSDDLRCSYLIDSEKLMAMTAYLNHEVNPDFTYNLASESSVRTIFVGNIEYGVGHSIISSAVSVGYDSSPFNNVLCASGITDGGWYECPSSLKGRYISIYRENSRNLG